MVKNPDNPFTSSTTVAEYKLQVAYDIEKVTSFQQREGSIDVCYACWFIRKGRVDVIEGDKTYTATTNQWMLSDPFRKRTQKFATDTHLLSVRFKVKWGGFGYLPPHQTIRVVSHERNPEFLSIAEQLVLHQETPPNRMSEHCNKLSHFYKWLSIWHSLRTTNIKQELNQITDPRIQAAADQLNTELGLGVINYKALEQITQLSRAQIDRLFKVQFDLTPRQWCERQCLFQAEDWLSETNYSIKEIASRLQFFDASHFAKWFRKQTGHSPQDFRRELWV